jgi:hypothetical protein
MTPAEIIQDVLIHGGKVAIDRGDLTLTAPQPLPADLLQELRAHKAELINYLHMEAANSDSAERRRIEVLSMLAQEPSVTHAFVTDDDAKVDYVIVTVGIGGIGTCELRIPREKYDGLAVLKLIEEHTGATAQVRQVH